MQKNFNEFIQKFIDAETIKNTVLVGTTDEDGNVKNTIPTNIQITLNLLRLYHEWVSKDD